MWPEAEAIAARSEGMEARITKNIWQPLLPEQVALLQDPKKPQYLRYYKHLAEGRTDEQIAKIEAEQFGSQKSAQTIGNEIGIINRALGLGNADARDQVVLRLIHSGLIKLDEIQMKNGQQEQIILRIPFLGDNKLQILKLYAAGYTTKQIAGILDTPTAKTIANQYPEIYDGLGKGLATDSMLTASLAYLRHFGLHSVEGFIPNPVKETTKSYDFSHIIVPKDLPAIYDRQRPVYEFLETFNSSQLAKLCQNLTNAEQDTLETYVKTGRHTSDSIYSAQVILGAKSPAEAALVYLTNKRKLPPPGQFGLTQNRMVAIWYYARGYNINQIASILNKKTDAVKNTLETTNEALRVNFGQNSATRSVLKLVELGFPIDDLLQRELSNLELEEYIGNFTEKERETLELRTNPYRPSLYTLTKADLGVPPGTISSREGLLSDRLKIPLIQLYLIYLKGKQLGLLERIPPKVRPNGRFTIKN